MPLTSPFLPNASADVVAVLNQDTFEQIFSDARPIKVTVNETATVMKHPVETGAVRTDHIVYNPNEIELSVFLLSKGNVQDYRSVYQQIRQVYMAADLVTVQTRTGSYANMLIYEMPHDEDTDMFDAVAVAIKLTEVQIVTATYGKLPPAVVRNKAQSSTVDRGEQQPTDANNPSILRQATDYIGVTSP